MSLWCSLISPWLRSQKENWSAYYSLTETTFFFRLIPLSMYHQCSSFLSSCLHTENGSCVKSINVKEWQDGLRALLPNININFGGLPTSFSSSSSSCSSSSIDYTGSSGVSGSVSRNLRWDGTASWMDPAIIRGKSKILLRGAAFS